MLEAGILAEADRQLTVCNACRYCEGVCPVFPALERRRTFTEGDIVYLANLCHDCRVCFDVCPYSPPHELFVNFPKIMAEVREETYRGYAAPRLLSAAFREGTRTMAIISFAALAIILFAVFATRSDQLFQAHAGPGAFYKIIPWMAMFVPAMAMVVYGLAVLRLGLVRFWRDTDGPFAARVAARAFASATSDVLLLRQMRGGGPGCTYPGERQTHRRVVLHQLVFYGLLMTLLSTALATLWQEILGVLPPYPLLHPVVISGTVGGVAQILGCTGLLALKVRSSSVPASTVMRSLDVAFLVALLVVNATGLVLLAARESSAMGLLLAVHLAAVASLFIAMPYGKFVHVIYRYAALVRNRQEERLEQANGYTAAD